MRLQIEQFRKQYGIVRNVSDQPVCEQQFPLPRTEDITPIQKQDLEGRFWELCNGGKIQYVRYPVGYNKGAIKTLIERAMELGTTRASTCPWLTAMTAATRNSTWMSARSAVPRT